VDDYAEIWVDGSMPHALGQAGGPVVAGFNAPNRVVLGSDVRPGQHFQIAVFGINGPISVSPTNYIWMRTATLDFHSAGRARTTRPAPCEIVRADAGLDAVVPPEARLEQVAGGFEFTEGPVWAADGALLFSSPNTNVIYRWTPLGAVTVFRPKSGYTGDLVYRSDGTLYFTDPPFGLPDAFDDPKKELPFSGVFRVKDGTVALVTDELEGPNGLAFSPDERYLYVGNWDPRRKVVMRYEVDGSGAVSSGTVLFDMTAAPGEDAIDGLKVDQAGNLYVCGPSGIWVLSSKGTHLGTVRLPEAPHNLAWGDRDGRTLYITALTSIYRMRLAIPGIRP
jgi:gluconolactonase